MRLLEWHEAIAQVEPYVFQIHTPDGSGTGCLLSRSAATPFCVAVTAAHVVDHAHYWEEPIRLVHHVSGESLLLRQNERGINIDEATDTAAVAFNRKELKLPDASLPLMKRDYHLKPGVQVGWLGFPALAKSTLCFFSGHISAYLDNESSYLVDGVAINGVSGGPAFIRDAGTPQLIGVLSAYIPNRATGVALPGVALLRDVNRFHEFADSVKTVDEAIAKQTPKTEPPPASVEPAAPTPTRG